MRCLVLRGPAQSKYTWTFHKSHFVWKFNWKAPEAIPRHPFLREPAQLKCTWTFHKSYFAWEFTGKMAADTSGGIVLCEPAQSKCTWTCVEIYRDAACVAHGHRFVRACAAEMHMDMSQEPLCMEIYRELAGHGWYHLDWTPGLNCYHKNPSVWPHCLGKYQKLMYTTIYYVYNIITLQDCSFAKFLLAQLLEIFKVRTQPWSNRPWFGAFRSGGSPIAGLFHGKSIYKWC